MELKKLFEILYALHDDNGFAVRSLLGYLNIYFPYRRWKRFELLKFFCFFKSVLNDPFTIQTQMHSQNRNKWENDLNFYVVFFLLAQHLYLTVFTNRYTYTQFLFSWAIIIGKNISIRFLWKCNYYVDDKKMETLEFEGEWNKQKKKTLKLRILFEIVVNRKPQWLMFLGYFSLSIS